MKLCRAVLVRRDGLGWAGATVSESSEPLGRAGREGHQAQQTRVGGRRGRPGLPQGPTSPGAVPEPGAAHTAVTVPTQTVHPRRFVTGTNLKHCT